MRDRDQYSDEHHEEELGNRCNICCKTFSKPDSLKCHHKAVHEEIKTKCSICDMQLASGKISALYSLGWPKMQKFGNLLLPIQKVMQMTSETMPTLKKLPYL